jgi:hypothetical protein
MRFVGVFQQHVHVSGMRLFEFEAESIAAGSIWTQQQQAWVVVVLLCLLPWTVIVLCSSG